MSGTSPGRNLDRLRDRIVACERCPRLRRHCREVARTRRRAYADWTYWGRPLPGFGDPRARLLILGLAPAAHGANRTGRMFTGDRSGDFLFAALHRAGFANRPESTRLEDGLRLRDAYVTAAVRCAPPGNRPLPEEAERCRGYLVRELEILTSVRAVLALGRFAHDAYLRTLRSRGIPVTLSGVRFGHGARHPLPQGPILFDSYHPSQQNTFTGRLTPGSFDRILRGVRVHLERGDPAARDTIDRQASRPGRRGRKESA